MSLSQSSVGQEPKKEKSGEWREEDGEEEWPVVALCFTFQGFQVYQSLDKKMQVVCCNVPILSRSVWAVNDRKPKTSFRHS